MVVETLFKKGKKWSDNPKHPRDSNPGALENKPVTNVNTPRRSLAWQNNAIVNYWVRVRRRPLAIATSSCIRPSFYSLRLYGGALLPARRSPRTLYLSPTPWWTLHSAIIHTGLKSSSFIKSFLSICHTSEAFHCWSKYSVRQKPKVRSVRNIAHLSVAPSLSPSVSLFIRSVLFYLVYSLENYTEIPQEVL